MPRSVNGRGSLCARWITGLWLLNTKPYVHGGDRIKALSVLVCFNWVFSFRSCVVHIKEGTGIKKGYFLILI